MQETDKKSVLLEEQFTPGKLMKCVLIFFKGSEHTLYENN